MEGIVELIREIDSTFKKNCSCFRLPSFTKKNRAISEPIKEKDISEANNEQDVSVVIRKGIIRIKRNFSIFGFSETLDHFSKIYRNETTYSSSGDKEVDDERFQFLDKVQFVEKGKDKILTEKLLRRVYSFCLEGKKGVISLCHRFYIHSW